MSAVALVMMLAVGQSPSPESEFELPSFQTAPADGGLSAPPAPPNLALTEPRQVFPQAPDEPQPPATWAPVTGVLSLNLLPAGTFGIGFEGFLGLTLGTPTERAKAGADEPKVEGWVLTPGLEAGYAQLSARACERTTLCAGRLSVGGSVRLGWAQGHPDRKTGVTRPNRMYFGQLSVLGGHAWVPSAPLAPALRWWELVIRARVGVLLALVKWPVFSVAMIFEAVPVSAGNQGVSVGLGVGFSF